MSNKYITISIADEVQYDALKRSADRMVDQYALCIRRGLRDTETFRQMLVELQLHRDQLDRIEKQASKLLEDFK